MDRLNDLLWTLLPKDALPFLLNAHWAFVVHKDNKECEREVIFTMKVTSTSCICPVLVCLCFVQRCYGTAHHSSIKVTRNQTKHIEGETEVHHRPKRGWVWNQFFVLEEHMGPDPQYVGKVSLFWFLWNCLLFFLLLRNSVVKWRWSWQMKGKYHTACIIESRSLNCKNQNYCGKQEHLRLHLF